MSKSLSFWAALASIEGMLTDESETLFLWTFTGAENETRQDRAILMKRWAALFKQHRWRALNPRGFRSTEQGTQGEKCWHVHAVTDQRWPIAEVKAAAEPVGFGRINVREIPRKDAGYAAKYLLKQGTLKGARRWATFGEVSAARSSDIHVYDQFSKYATEGLQCFPRDDPDSKKYWWSECLYRLACAFLRQRPGVKPPVWTEQTLARYQSFGNFAEAQGRALHQLSGRLPRARRVVHPRVGIYCGRWVPEFTVTDKRTGKQWARRQARHLVAIAGVFWWIREPGAVPMEIPAERGQMVVIGFMWNVPVGEIKIAGEAVGFVQAVAWPRCEGVGVHVATAPGRGGAEDVTAAREVPEGATLRARLLPTSPVTSGSGENPF